MKNGYLIISLDFELLWGIFDVMDYKKNISYFRNTREIIPRILDLFSKNEIHCTWAVVGMLFNRNWEDWEMNKPAAIPYYSDYTLSAYRFGWQNKCHEIESMVFAPDLVRLISQTPNQEIGTHSYSHYYCLEEGQTVRHFREDLKLAVELARRDGIELKSMVFPRNQFKKEYLTACYDLGIRTVRTNPSTWYWKKPESDSFMAKIGRTGDAYNLFGEKKSYPFNELKLAKNLPLQQKASRFLRPHEKNPFLNGLKMRRLLSEMKSAAQKKELYHLWWHPHNFGTSPEESYRDLELIINQYRECNMKYGFRTATMNEIFELTEKQELCAE